MTKKYQKMGKISFICLFVLYFASLASHADVRINPVESWTNVFSGEKTAFHFTINSDKPSRIKALWRFSTGSQTVTRGQRLIDIRTGEDWILKIELRIPEIKEAHIVKALLSLQLHDAETDLRIALTDKTVVIFSEFVNLKKQNILLFDPSNKTAKIFTDLRIPFKQTRNVDALADMADGILIIAEGLSFNDYRGLPEMMLKTAESGIPVLCLAPLRGEIPMPANESAYTVPSYVGFAGKSVIRSFGKYLDAETWRPGGIELSGLNLRCRNDSFSCKVEKPGLGWPWMEMRFAGGNSKLVVCCFGIIEKWNSSPAPRFLFARILDCMSETAHPK